MANRYWVGGTDTWNATAGSKWATTDGGAGGAAVPTSADDVFFTAKPAPTRVSNTAYNLTNIVTPVTGNGFHYECTTAGTTGASEPVWPTVAGNTVADGTVVWTCRSATVTLGATANVLSADFTGYTRTFAGSSSFNVYGNLTIVSAMTWSYNGLISALGTGTLITGGKTINQLGVTGGNLTLGSAATIATLTINSGTFSTANYTFTANIFNSANSNVRTINFGSSTVSIPITWNITPTNLTFNAGTSTMTVSNTNAFTFSGQGLTYYNVTLSSGGTTVFISGVNTFNNLTFTSLAPSPGIGAYVLNNDQTVNGILTLGTSNTAIRRTELRSGTGTSITITHNGTLAGNNDVDFRNITVTGTAAPWTGTRFGDLGNNSGITTSTPKTVYWNLSGTQNWSATAWATTNNGTPALGNFPLAQDTAVFTEAGAAGSITYNANWYVGTIQMADGVSNRTTAFTLTLSNSANVMGNVTLFSNLTLGGTGTLTFLGRNTTQTFITAGKSIPWGLTFGGTNSTIRLGDACTHTFSTGSSLLGATLDLNTFLFTTPRFTSSNISIPRSIIFGTSRIDITGDSATILSLSGTGAFTASGTPYFRSTYTGSVGTRTISTSDLTESSANTIANVAMTGTSGIVLGTTATDTIALTGNFGNVDLTGITNTLSNTARTVYGNFTIPATGGTLTSGGSATTFGATSGTKQFVTNGRTVDFPIVFNGLGGTFQIGENVTIGSSATTTLTAGTLDLTGNSGNWTLTTLRFASTGTSTRAINFGTGQILINGNGATVWDTSTSTGLTYTGTFKVVSNYAGSAFTRSFSLGGLNVDVKAGAAPGGISFGTAGTDIVSISGTAKNLDTTGFSGTLANASRSITGNLTIASTTTVAAGTGVTTFAATSGTQLITVNGKTLDFPITINASGALVQPQENITSGSTRTTTLTAGTLDLTGNSGNWTWTTGNFSSDNSNTRSVVFGTGKIVLNSNSSTTVWGFATATGFSYTGTPRVELSAGSSVSQTMSHGSTAGGSEANAVSFFISGGTNSTLTTTAGSHFRTLNLTSFTGTFANTARTLYGDLALQTSGTMSSGSNTTTFAATSGTQNITSNGRITAFPIAIDGVGGTVRLLDAFNSARSVTLTNGTFDANNNNVTVVAVLSSNSNIRTITMGSGTWTLSGTGTVWNLAAVANLTFNKNTANIVLSDTSTIARTFNGGGLTYNNLTIGGTTGTSTLTITGSNTFATLASTKTVAHTVLFEAGSTTNVASWTITGTVGNVVTLGSTATSQFTLNKTGGGTVTGINYLNISYSNATPLGTWAAGSNSTDGGNNTGWTFGPVPLGGSASFFMFF